MNPTTPQANQPQATASKVDEKILVVRRQHLFSTNEDLIGRSPLSPLMTPFTGFQPLTDFTSIQALITKYQEFQWRSTMENDPSFKQIIPYLIFEHNDTYFLMRRRSTASEQRLKNKCSLGIGGHIRQEDMDNNNLIDWAQREFHEEVSYHGNLVTIPLGLINDESNAVGQVHIGFVFLLRGNSSNITIRAEHKEGALVSLDACKAVYDELESWSQFVYDYLINSLK